MSTIFHVGDGMSGKRFGCAAAARRLLGSDRLRTDLPVIATRGKADCGKLVVVEHVRSKRRTVAIKLDTGPWGCRLRDGSRVVVGPGQCASRGARISQVDLSPPVAIAIGHDGWDRIRVWR